MLACRPEISASPAPPGPQEPAEGNAPPTQPRSDNACCRAPGRPSSGQAASPLVADCPSTPCFQQWCCFAGPDPLHLAPAGAQNNTPTSHNATLQLAQVCVGPANAPVLEHQHDQVLDLRLHITRLRRSPHCDQQQQQADKALTAEEHRRRWEVDFDGELQVESTPLPLRTGPETPLIPPPPPPRASCYGTPNAAVTAAGGVCADGACAARDHTLAGPAARAAAATAGTWRRLRRPRGASWRARRSAAV